jgi:hypothetical protein
MAGLWNIYRSDGRQLGPYSASEVREALRDGSIDPFDQVARVGSKLKQSLVEVDQIFLEIDGEVPKVDSVYNQNEEFANRGHNLVPTAHSQPLAGRGARSTAISAGRNQAGGAQPMVGITPANRRINQAKKHAKRFYLFDRRNRLLGPLSAAEIQSLFYRGIIDQDVLVSKDKGERRIPVQQFIAAYVGAKAKKFRSEQTRLHLEPGGQYAYPSSRVMEQMSRSVIAMPIRRTSSFPWLSVLVLAIAMAGAALLVMKYFFPEKLLRPGPRDFEYPQSIQLAGPDQHEIPSPQTTTTPQMQRPTHHAPQQVQQQVVPLPTPEPAPLPTPKPIVKARLKLTSKPTPKPIVRNSRGRLTRPPPPRAMPKPIQQQRILPPPSAPVRPVPAKRPAPLDPYINRVGSIVTVDGASYNAREVSSCGGMKCTITFRDRSGTSFMVVYFRARYQDQLVKAKGRATITGRLSQKDSSYIIYLSGVR